MEHTFTDAAFETDVLKSSVPVLVDFWAPWCGPCRMMAPVIEEIAAEMSAEVLKVGKCNVDENPKAAQTYGIMSIPSFLIFKNGQVVEQFSGSIDKETLKDRIQKHIA
ncbi:thioredoxin [Patescibacteria group bacterium]|nr:thioredoxin [Patescibacteria group bacterium]MBU1035049.1 thioredoxin [Patescibacteria group bacterium]MBU1630084.1 thioredoxin [Patescibacteria group bacterium]MBU1908063.1 thioredoxin [Patescibacteria group bacterium]